MLLVAIPVFALALFFLLLAWLSGHRTPIPMAVRPAWFYFPGLLLLALTGLILLLPSMLAWNRCNNECQLTGDLATAHEQCVASSRRSIGRDLLTRHEDWTDADVEAYFEENGADVEEQCTANILGGCVGECFERWRFPERFEDETVAGG